MLRATSYFYALRAVYNRAVDNDIIKGEYRLFNGVFTGVTSEKKLALDSHRQIDTKIYCCKLTVPSTLQTIIDGIGYYIADKTHDSDLWTLKYKELIRGFTRYYQAEELRSFFHPMTDEQVPFKSLVLTHYRKAEYTDKLAEMCGYGLHNFRKVFKKEFGVSSNKWLIMKRAENIKYVEWNELL